MKIPANEKEHYKAGYFWLDDGLILTNRNHNSLVCLEPCSWLYGYSCVLCCLPESREVVGGGGAIAPPIFWDFAPIHYLLNKKIPIYCLPLQCQFSDYLPARESMFFAALLWSNHWTYCSFQWLKLNIWVLGISSIFKFENWLGTLVFVTFWKLGVFDKNPKIMKSAYFKSDFFGHFQLQILTTCKPLEIVDAWNQVQIIPWYLSFCRGKVPGEYIYPVKRKPYGLFW